MNPKYHLLVAIAALSLNACSTDDTGTVPENDGYKISFTVAEDTETRTTLTTGDCLRWLPIDKVGIYTSGNNVNSNILTTADVNKSPVEFVGTLEQPVSSGDMFYAYYPYNAEQSTDPSVVKLSIPTEQKQAKAGVYNGESHPLVALPMEFSQEWGNAGRMSSVRFRQLGAIVELQLYSSDEALRSEAIRSVTFEADTPLAGDFPFDLTAVTDKGELTISGYESKEAATLLEESAAIPAADGEAARIYLTIAPGLHAGQIVVKTDIAQYTFRLVKAITFERAVIKGLPADLAKAEREIFPDAPIRFEDPEVERICVENWDTNGDGVLSYEEAAAVTWIEDQLFQSSSIRSFNELQYFTGLRSIGAGAFYNCSSLTNIHLPNGLTAIGEFAFRGCNSLTSINIPDGVITIVAGVFYDCSSLTSVHIPDGVTRINSLTFYGCSGLTSIDIPDGVTAIDGSAFSGCSSLTSIHIPDGVTAIGNSVFQGCSSLKSINIPDKVTAIGHWAFIGCSSLTSLNIPNKVTAIGSSAFQGCSSLTSINIPEGVTAIEDFTFLGCSSLKSINIPEGVTKIGEEAFADCSSLTSLDIPQTISSIGTDAFVRCSALSAFKGKYASADHRCLILDGTLFAFARAGLTEYTIPDGVTTIGGAAFAGCSSLTSIQIPERVTAIGNSAFSGCSSLTNITIPKGVTAIGVFAFFDCHSLTSVYCKPTTPPTLGNYAFSFSNAPSFTDPLPSLKIYVPTASVKTYKSKWFMVHPKIQIFADND